MNRSGAPCAVVIGVSYGGYGIVRSLSGYGVRIIGFETHFTHPEVHTRLCEVRAYEDEDDLLRRLVALSRAEASKPVLYLTRDDHVEFCARHLGVLREHYRIDFPAPDVVETLLHKDAFARFAEAHGFSVPRTVIFEGRKGFEERLGEVKLPCILKPHKRSESWLRAGEPKVLHFEERAELERALNRLIEIEEHLIVQEWIPGGDDAIHFCLVYYNAEAQCLGAFTARKLRQWPPSTGTTSATEPVHAPAVEEETLRLFDAVSYAGFGSVEFKRHARTGAFYITEPTVGRVNQQSFVATANGVNLPRAAYTSLTGHVLPEPMGQTPATVYCDEEAELNNLIRHLFRGGLDLQAMARSYRRPNAFRYYAREDLRPFLHFLGQMMKRVPKQIVKEAVRQLK